MENSTHMEDIFSFEDLSLPAISVPTVLVACLVSPIGALTPFLFIAVGDTDRGPWLLMDFE
jgi:hypothetical protein